MARESGRSLLDLFSLIGRLAFPNPCPGCARQLIPAEDGICFECSANLPRTNMEHIRQNPLELTLATTVPVQAAMALFHFRTDNSVQRLLHQLKYENRQDIGEALGRRMGKALVLSPAFQSIDTLVPLPLHPAKQQRRGFNQSLCIAQGISKVTGAQVISNAVTRTRDTVSQTKQKGRIARHQNVSSAFRVTQPGWLAGKNILLVDDVFTTGATAAACLGALAEIPNAQLWFAAAATPH